MAAPPPSPYLDPYEDIPSWWTYFFSSGGAWRWFESLHLYFRPGLEYRKPDSAFTVVDGLGREKTYDRPFECYIDPALGKISKLYVQAPGMLCRMPASEANCTWKRTPINNVTPIMLRIANLPYRVIPASRRGLPWSRLTGEDRWKVVLMWLPTVAAIVVSKDPNRYLPIMYRGLRYPRLARNVLENREQHDQSSRTVISTYRTFRPRFLNYLSEVDMDGHKTFDWDCRPVPQNDLTPFVMVCYSSAHYDLSGGDGDDLERLISVSAQAAIDYFQLKPGSANLKKTPRAFWTSANCIPPNQVAAEDGTLRRVDGLEAEILANQDASYIVPIPPISDIIRAAQHVIIVAGNTGRDFDPDELRVWGQRIWTLPEVVLSRGDSVTVWHCGKRAAPGPSFEVREIPKALFPTEAWPDAANSRQLIEHYNNLHLSRLELVKIALECLMSRRFRSLHPGDRTDTAFQAFARLSLPQDGDRLMERLICLLPDFPEQNWELMTDQYQASLWDIYPDKQVCAIGENDTVVVDGAKGAQIQWSHFTQLRTLRKSTMKRSALLFTLTWSPLNPYAQSSSSTSSNPAYLAAIAIIVIALVLILPAPYFFRLLFSGKLWVVEPCFLGIEGYVPLEAIEERIFGTTGGPPRLQWSAYGSPLARHKQGGRVRERTVHHQYPESEDGDGDLQQQPLLRNAGVVQQDVGAIDTYPVETIDPTAPCDECRGFQSGNLTYAFCRHHPTVASCQDMSRSPMGKMKVFTLVDTFSLIVTLFYAVRPPTILLVGGSEGGTKRAIACSFDMTTGTLYRETVLRIPTQCAGRMESLPRVRLGLARPFLESDAQNRHHYQQYQPPPLAPPAQQQQQYQQPGQQVESVVPVQYTHEPKV
ncbi:hypothetical protein B0H63DRAFT_545665 [Podospora didyma]|uniref:Uncharacterized protein n=1 Tax=Podospora didyma TaxID=330526 RepID=A0AAE0NGV6_9PEZI|nr:hypothetical protein B0H63DRAFT_545665 [Podospora didyma]